MSSRHIQAFFFFGTLAAVNEGEPSKGPGSTAVAATERSQTLLCATRAGRFIRGGGSRGPPQPTIDNIPYLLSTPGNYERLPRLTHV